MNITINPQAPLPIYAQLMEQIKELIQSGHMGAGDSLPSVRQMADQIEVNSLTIQKAYKGLEADGWIVIKKGVGAFVSESVKQVSRQVKEEKLEQDARLLVKRAKQDKLDLETFVEFISSLWEET